jgi:hypothetical protein
MNGDEARQPGERGDAKAWARRGCTEQCEQVECGEECEVGGGGRGPPGAADRGRDGKCNRARWQIIAETNASVHRAASTTPLFSKGPNEVVTAKSAGVGAEETRDWNQKYTSANAVPEARAEMATRCRGACGSIIPNRIESASARRFRTCARDRSTGESSAASRRVASTASSFAVRQVAGYQRSARR